MGSWEHKHTILYYFFNRCVAVITFPEIGAHQNLPTSSISNSCVRMYVLSLNSLLNFILHFQRFYINQVDKNTNTLVLQIWLNFLSDFPGSDPGLKKLRRAKGGAKIFGVFLMKNHDFTPKNHIFSNFRGAPPWIGPCFRCCTWSPAIYLLGVEISEEIVPLTLDDFFGNDK